MIISGSVFMLCSCALNIKVKLTLNIVISLKISTKNEACTTNSNH